MVVIVPLTIPVIQFMYELERNHFETNSEQRKANVPNSSSKTLAKGAKQLVVQDALLSREIKNEE